MGQRSRPDRAYIDFGRPDGRKLCFNHVGYRLNIEWLDSEELRIYEAHMSPLLLDGAKGGGSGGQRFVNQSFHAYSHHQEKRRMLTRTSDI